jgi:hypothetical protein
MGSHSHSVPSHGVHTSSHFSGGHSTSSHSSGHSSSGPRSGDGGMGPNQNGFTSHHRAWYSGHWHSHLNGHGFRGYGGFGCPLAWGRSGWGSGRAWYRSGYVRYYNPYYASLPDGASGCNYAQPIEVDGGMPVAGDAAEDGTVDPLDAAVEHFQAGGYPDALTLVDQAIADQPSDAAAHELRALLLFGMQDYLQAAATIHSVLAVGPGWDWTTLCNLYPDMTVYTAQLRALEAYVSHHPQQGDAAFLLAYHYLIQGHIGSAASQLKAVVSLAPDDQLAADLLRMLTGKEPASPPTRPAPGPDVPAVDPAAPVGDWHANRFDGSSFELDLANDKTFTWKFSHEQESRTVMGTYTVDKRLLILQSEAGEMVGTVSGDGDRFTFKPLGSPPDDPGLTFVK